MRRAFLLALVMTSCCVAAARAQQPAPPGTLGLAPAVATERTEFFTIDARPLAGTPVNEVPTAMAIDLPRGFNIDPRSVARLCTAAEAARIACPKASQVAFEGYFQATVSGYLMPGGQFDIIGVIAAYLGQPQVPGDIASLVLEATESVTGQRSALTGRIFRLRGGPYGIEVTFGAIASALPYVVALARATGGLPVAGVTVTLDRLKLFFNALTQRTVKFKGRGSFQVVTQNGLQTRSGFVTKTRTFYLFSNPKTCKGSWPFALRASFPTATIAQVGRHSCSRPRHRR